jgi:predicted negative regulator of RcsB-dependent stress response
MKALKNSNGFSAIHALLILVIIGIVGFTGWYVWNANQEADKDLKAADSSVVIKKTNPDDTQSTDVDKVTVQANDGFSFEYPKSWIVVAYSADETVNGGQVAANDKKAIQWRLLSKDSNTNAMCVELRVSNLKNAGIFMSEATAANSDNGDNKIWFGKRGDISYAVLRSSNSTDNFLKLGDDRALTVYAAYDCAQRMTTTYSVDEQQKTQDYKDALNILRSVKISSSTTL